MPSRAPATLSDQLKEVIESRRLTGNAVAELAEVEPRSVQRWLKGERDLSLGYFDRIAAALGVRLVEVAARRRKV